MGKRRCIRDLEFAYMTHEEPPWPPHEHYTDAQRRGLRYEGKAVKALEETYSPHFLPHPWFYYRDRHDSRARWCQPDGILIFPHSAKIVVTEIKLRHTREAYYQLFELYLPVVMHTFGHIWRYGCLEVVRWYDPSESVPKTAHLCKEPSVINPGVFGVHILRV